MIFKSLGGVGAALLIGCGGGSPTTDGGLDGGSDVGRDTASDVPVDSGMACGNGVLDELEACDGIVFRDDRTCGDLGLPAGTLACTSGCEIDTVSCAVCDDGICSDGETSTTCAQDCGVRSIAAGRTHTCAVLADGSLWCWGARDGHRMGGASDTNVPIRVPGHDNTVQVTVGDHHTCFTTSENEVWCFGANGFGEAGPATSHDVFPPIMVTAGERVSAGANHTCAVAPTSGDVLCWGRGDYGQQGRDEFSMRQSSPEIVVRGGPARDVALGGHISCSALETNIVRCWGDNTHALMGSRLDWKSVPYTILALPGVHVVGIAVGDSHACFNVQLSDGTDPQMVCAGGNAYGQTGAEPSTTTMAVAFPGVWMPMTAGFGYACAQDLSVPGSPHLRCWGDNYFGQLGDDTFEGHHVPEEVVGITEVTALSGGADHVCVILPDETARCWGRNREGQLGNASLERAHATPVVPVGLGGTP